MHSCVLGAGVIGVTTAYQLLMAGHEVSLIEEQPQVASMSSMGNGAQLSYSYVAPLADASIWRKWPEYLFSSNSPLSLKPQLDMNLWRWLFEFLAVCNDKDAKQNSRELLLLAQFSQLQLDGLKKQHELNFQHQVAGKLVMLSNQASIDAAAEQIEFQAQFGCKQSIFGIGECVELEPALAHAQQKWLAGVYTPSEEVGDCAIFCQSLLLIMQKSPRFHFLPSSHIESVQLDGQRLVSVSLKQGELKSSISADHFIVSMGVGSANFAKKLGFRLPVYPLKGYSITVPIKESSSVNAPQISITDLSQKIVYARLGDYLRVAGRVELVGLDWTVSNKAIKELVSATQYLFPDCGDVSDITQLSPWAGLRPATPTGLPIIGKSPISNVYLNIGHGALGWTLACGSASLLRNIICGEKPEINISAFEFKK